MNDLETDVMSSWFEKRKRFVKWSERERGRERQRWGERETESEGKGETQTDSHRQPDRQKES